MEERNESVIASSSASVYRGSVGARAYKRAGNCKNLNGHAFEIMYQDTYNANLKNRLAGRKAYLTKSNIASRDDIIVKDRANHVVKRFQCKDTSSKSGIRDTTRRIESGQYKKTNLVGTTETADAVNQSLGAGTMDSSKISSNETALVNREVNGGNPLAERRAITYTSTKVAKKAFLLSATINGYSNVSKCKKGELDIDEAIVKTTIKSGESASSAWIATLADTSVTMIVACIPGMQPLAKPIGFAAGIAVGIGADYTFNKGHQFLEQKVDNTITRQILRCDDGYSHFKRKMLYSTFAAN